MIGKKEWSVNINPSSSMEANFLNLLMFLCFLTVTEGMLLLSKAVNMAYNISVVVHLSMKCAKMRKRAEIKRYLK